MFRYPNVKQSSWTINYLSLSLTWPHHNIKHQMATSCFHATGSHRSLIKWMSEFWKDTVWTPIKTTTFYALNCLLVIRWWRLINYPPYDLVSQEQDRIDQPYHISIHHHSKPNSYLVNNAIIYKIWIRFGVFCQHQYQVLTKRRGLRKVLSQPSCSALICPPFSVLVA